MNQEKNTEKSFSKEKARSAYKAIKTGAIPILEAFKDDLLVHDKREITQDFPGRPFLHFTRKNGTHILMLYCLTDYPRQGSGSNIFLQMLTGTIYFPTTAV